MSSAAGQAISLTGIVDMGQFDILLGPMLVGALFNMYLYGVVSTQYATYHGTKFDDYLWIKLIIGLLFVLDTVQTASITYWIYDGLVDHFTDPAHIIPSSLQRTWPSPWSLLSNAINAALAETVLTYRIFRLTKNRYLLSVFTTLITTVVSLGFYCSIRGFILVSEADLQAPKHVIVPTLVWRVAEVVLDLSLSGTLIFVLQRARTGQRRSEAIINSVIGHAVKTGVFMAMYSIAVAASMVDIPSVAVGISMSQGKVATNTLLMSLLKRRDYQRVAEQQSTSIFNRLDVESRGNASNSTELRTVKGTRKALAETKVDDKAGTSDLCVGEVTFKKRTELP